MMIGLIAVGAAVVLFLFYLVSLYNRLVKRRNQVDNAWGQIDVQLKRRYDLIPNLVETVKGYASHERGIFEAVSQARARAVGAGGPQEAAEADGVLTGTLRTLFAVAEAYPDLKANQNFLALQQELATTEDRAAYARQYYNDAVLGLNNAVSTFPTVLFAAMLGFRSREFFRAAGAETAPVRVQF
ncbi:LemA family protein [Catenulispora subtropica]|uniref:LemA family protein n=1 Tax=Catenulispora subtropica TaxID=450798 RepID=A0ABP5CX83_9ACTN